MKSSGASQEGVERKPQIEIMEETPSFTGGFSGMSGPTAPPLISSASLRRFSTSQPSHPGEPVQENRLASAARELKDAAWQRAMEVKDTTLQYAGKLQQKYNLPLGSWMPAATTGLSTWELYGRKKKESTCLFEQAEQKLREARAAPPERASDLYLDANILKQKALKKAMKAQQLADKMKCKVDCQVDQLRKTTPDTRDKKMTAWELFGHTKQKANRLRARAEVMEQEARQTQDQRRAGELLEEASRLRKKALNTAEEAQAYADGIKRAADDKVLELRKWAMRNEGSGVGGGSGIGSTPMSPPRPHSFDNKYQPPTSATKY